MEGKMEGKKFNKTRRLTPAAFSRGLPPGRYYDGANNGLDFESYGNRRGCWGIRIMVDGARHYFGVGGYPRVSLKKARKLADKIKRRLLKGKPPLPEKVIPPAVPSFEEASCAAREKRRGPLSEDRIARQWKSTFDRYVPGPIRTKAVSKIVSPDILSALEPIWDSKRPTAVRLRSFMRQTLAWAIAHGFRVDNPAGDVLKGALKSEGHTVVHRPSHHYSQVGAAVAKFREGSSTPEVRLLYEILALTAVRTGELRCLRWDEIDWDSASFIVPQERMKQRHEFAVPMSFRVVLLFKHARRTFREADFVFPGKNLSSLSRRSRCRML